MASSSLVVDCFLFLFIYLFSMGEGESNMEPLSTVCLTTRPFASWLVLLITVETKSDKIELNNFFLVMLKLVISGLCCILAWLVNV